MFNKKRSILWALSVCATPPLFAQTAPNAGSIFQQLEQSKPKRGSEAPIPTPSSPAPPTESDASTASVLVKQFKFVTNARIPVAKLEAVVQPYLNRPITFAELQNAAADVANLHHQQGWLVNASYPEQDITNGEVTMEVHEASWGGVAIHSNRSRIPDLRVINTFEQAIHNDEPLLFGIDRGLSLLNELPGVNAEYSLQQGKTAQTIQTRLDVSAGPLVQANVSIDNQGSRSTGENRLVGQIIINSLNPWADRITLTSVNTEGMDYASLSYAIPIGYQGFRVGFSTGHLQYKVVEDSFSNVQALGRFDTQGIDFTYPIIRNPRAALNAIGNYETKEFENSGNANITSQYNTQTLTLGLNGTLADPEAPLKKSSEGSISITNGVLQNTLSGTSKTYYHKLNYALSIQRPLRNEWRMTGSIRGQYSKDPLDSSEKFYLGGPQGVRAYPTNEGGASNGRILSVELTRTLQSNLEFTGFYDWGKVALRGSEVFATEGAYILKGLGASLRWIVSPIFLLDATWAHRLGNNPNPLVNGADQDGTRDENRLWVRGSFRF